MVRHVVKVDCSGSFIEELNALYSDLCILFDKILFFAIFLFMFVFVRFSVSAFLLLFLWFLLPAQFHLVDAALLCGFVDLGRDNLIKTYGYPVYFTQQLSELFHLALHSEFYWIKHLGVDQVYCVLVTLLLSVFLIIIKGHVFFLLSYPCIHIVNEVVNGSYQ